MRCSEDEKRRLKKASRLDGQPLSTMLRHLGLNYERDLIERTK
jgi:hypothetical protein